MCCDFTIQKCDEVIESSTPGSDHIASWLGCTISGNRGPKVFEYFPVTFTQTLCLKQYQHVKHGPFTRYAKLWVAHAPQMPGMFSPSPWISDPEMHHSTCVTHVPLCMSGSLTSGFLWSRWGENVRGIRGASATRNFACLVESRAVVGVAR